MADKRISALDTATDLQGTEQLPLVQSSTTRKTTLTDVQHFIVNHLEPVTLTVLDGQTVDLNSSTYDETELIVLSWSGDSGSMTLTLPDATDSKNLNRVKRLISDSTFATNTHADLTPASGQNLDGSTAHYRINKAYEGITVWCNGTEWFIIQAKA